MESDTFLLLLSFTLLKLDEELEGLLSAPCDCAFWRVA